METVFFSLFDLFLKQTSSVVSPQALRKDLPPVVPNRREVSRHRRENLLQRQTISRPPPTEEERRWAREGPGSSYLQVVTTVHWKFHCLEIVKNISFSNALGWGRLLKHSAGLCLRPEEDDDGTLMLLSCSFPPVGVESRGWVTYTTTECFCAKLPDSTKKLKKRFAGRAKYSCGGVRESSLPP